MSKKGILNCPNGAIVSKKVVQVERTAFLYSDLKTQIEALKIFLGVEPILKIKNFDVSLYIKSAGGHIAPNTVLVKTGENVEGYNLERFNECFDVLNEILLTPKGNEVEKAPEIEPLKG